MATLFKRLNYYCHVNKKPHLSREQKMVLGKKIAQAYFSVKPPDKVFDHTLYHTENGIFKVLCYPKTFVPEIDRMIHEFYISISPKIRKRIPAKPLLQKSVKPLNNFNNGEANKELL